MSSSSDCDIRKEGLLMARGVFLQAETTTGSRKDAETLAAEMVRRRLAACAQILGPIRSVYWWNGAVESEEEYLVLFKTRETLAERFKHELAELHTYEVPEILLFEIRDGGSSYLDWLAGEVAPAATERAGE
jgi:periplasmic divalent cation tolerance protein